MRTMEEKTARDAKELTDRVKILGEKLASLRTFEVEKEGLERDIATFEAEIATTKLRKQEILSAKEREKILRNHESKIEMAAKLEEAKASLEKMKRKEIEVNAKLTILQNFQLSLELEAFGEKIQEMLKDNVRLGDLIERKNREIDIHKSSEVDFAEQERNKKKTILRLTTREFELQREVEELEAQCVAAGVLREGEEGAGDEEEGEEDRSGTLSEVGKGRGKERQEKQRGTLRVRGRKGAEEAEGGRSLGDCVSANKDLRMVG